MSQPEPRPASPSIERLAVQLAGAGDTPLTAELAGWMAASTTFRAFAEAHRDKIRKKVRAAGDDDAVLDVRAELLVARLLLADRRIEVGFETSGSTRGGPDFSVTVRGGRACNLEVTRPRRVPDRAALAELILAKLRQLPPGAPNALLVAIGGEAASALDVAGSVHLLRTRADARDEGWLGAHRLADPRAFYARFLRLGGVYALAEAAADEARAAYWPNPSARIAVPVPAGRGILRALRAGTPMQGSGTPRTGP